MSESVLAVAAATWGVAMALSPVLQVLRILRRRSSEDVSIAYYMVLMVGFGLWVAYGASIDNLALVIPNSVALMVGLITIAVALRFRTGEHPSPLS